jgi:hypothetical protein
LSLSVYMLKNEKKRKEWPILTHQVHLRFI